MPNDDVVPVQPHRGGGVPLQFLDQTGVEPMTRNAQVLKLVGFNEASGAIVFEHEFVSTHDVGALALFRCVEMVADEFKDDIIAWQSEHDHYHSARAFGIDETVVGVAEVSDKIAVELCLGMPVETDRVAKLGKRFPRH